MNGAKTDGFRRSEKLNEGLTIKNSRDYDEVYRQGNDGIPDGVLLRCHEGDGRPHGGGGDDAGAILDDGDRVSQAVHCFRRGLQELDEEPVGPGKDDITGIVWLAMFGSLYKISNEDMEDEKETKIV